MQKVLVAGASGLLGSSLAPYLKKCGYEVVTHAYKNKADFLFDLSDRKVCFEKLQDIKPAVIVNLAGLTNVEQCEKQVNLAYLSNTLAVENLIYWIKTTENSTHLVQISTDHLYDGNDIHSEDKVTITNNYAFSKYAGELAACSELSTVLRTNFIGRSHSIYRQSFTDWIYNSILTGQRIQVLNDIYFSPLSISKLVEIIELVIRLKPVGIYNLGSSGGMSKADFSFAFAKTLKLPTNIMDRVESREASFLSTYRPKDMRMNSSKIENILGIKLPKLAELIYQISIEYNDKA